MGFFSPWFLAGIAAVGLPIWLHLLKRHKTDPRPFPSLMFFEKREQSSVMHKRLDYILLFILRTAMLVLLVLLFANPFFNKSTPKAQGKKIVVVAVDHSFSMRADQGGESRLDKAKREANSVIAGIPGGTAAEVVALGGQLQAMTQQTLDASELRGAVASIQPTDERASFGDLTRFTHTLAQSSKTPLEVHLISDLQKTALPPGFADLRLDEDTTLILHPVGGPLPNWTVENVSAPARIYDPKKFRIQVTIAGFDTPAARRTVSLVVNGHPAQSKQIDVPANGRAQTEFVGLEASYGFNHCEVRIDSADALAADDRFPFSVERTDPKKDLFIDEGRTNTAQLYYRTALVDASPDAAFALDVQRPEVAAGANLQNYAVVVLNDVGTLPSSLSTALDRYVNGGGGLMVALGPNSAVMPRVPVANLTIDAGTRYASRAGDLYLTVADSDTKHPAISGLERLTGVRFYQLLHVNSDDKTSVLMRMTDQSPLLMEKQVGGGRVLTFAGPLDNTTNDLPVHPAYWVPFVQQTAKYLAGGGAEEQTNLPVDGFVELRGAHENKNAAAEVVDPDGKRALTLEESATLPSFQLTREGFFEVKTANGQKSVVAAHANRAESDMTPIPQETLDLWRGAGSGNAAADGSAGAGGTPAKTPVSLSPYLLLLLLLVVLVESVVSDRYLRPPADVQEGARREAA
jgi:hypothetical protein